MSSYNRYTELRNVHTKDLYNLAVILEDDNYWQKLMEVIPKEIINQTLGSDEELERISLGVSYERKYSNDHIRLIENAVRRTGESRLCSQILFEEWGTSGRKHERPTLGLLLLLLVQTKLYRAADFVAELLKEPKPPRPSNGPAAAFEFEVDVFNDIQEIVNDTRFYPNTEDLQENVSNDINKDYYTKYQQNIDKKLATIKDNREEPLPTIAPKPPPRLLKSAKLLKKQQQQKEQLLQQQQLEKLVKQVANVDNFNRNTEDNSKQETEFTRHSTKENMLEFYGDQSNNIPKLSELMNTSTNNETANTISTDVFLSSKGFVPKLVATNNSSEKIYQLSAVECKGGSLNSTPSLIFSNPNISEPLDEQHSELNSIPIVVLSKSFNTSCKSEESKSCSDTETHNLPNLSILNINGETDQDTDKHHQLNIIFGNLPNAAMDSVTLQTGSDDENSVTNEDLSNSLFVANTNYNQNLSKHQLESMKENCNGIEQENSNGIEHEHNHDFEVELEDDDDSMPNLSFLENRSSNNESSLTSVTNTSGENSFDQSVNDCSSTSADNLNFTIVSNQ